MKTILAILLFVAALFAYMIVGVCSAATNEAPVVFTTLYSDGKTNTWTQADLVEALGLLNRKYHRDCETASGRKAWHGRLKKEIINTNDLTRTEVYEDGKTFTARWKLVTPAMAVSNANKRLMVSTNGIPAKLAAARLRRAQEKATTNIVTTVWTTGVE
jgi:hypothetical protein